MCTILKENGANYILLERLINVDFGEKNALSAFLILQKKIAMLTAKMTNQINELIGYQNSADF